MRREEKAVLLQLLSHEKIEEKKRGGKRGQRSRYDWRENSLLSIIGKR